jgi:hypothetical protein
MAPTSNKTTEQVGEKVVSEAQMAHEAADRGMQEALHAGVPLDQIPHPMRAALTAALPILREEWEAEVGEKAAEAGNPHPVDAAFHKLTVKERDYERVRADRFERERDEAKALLSSLLTPEAVEAATESLFCADIYQDAPDDEGARIEAERCLRAAIRAVSGGDRG